MEKKLERKAKSGIMVTLLAISMLTLAFNIQPDKASGTKYIRADGSADPITALMQPDTGIYTSNSIDWWPMFRHDPWHSGYSTSNAPKTNQILWIQNLESFAESPSVADGILFIGCADGKVYALNASTGAHIWNYGVGQGIQPEIIFPPAVADGIVFVGASGDTRVYALNASTGTHIWNYTTVSSTWDVCPNVVDGKVYIGCYGRIYCLNASTGEHIWDYVTGGYVFSCPAVADGMVFVGCYEDCKVYALNASTGAFIWSYTTGDSVWGSAAVVNGRVYIGSGDSNLYCLNALNGAIIWSYSIGNGSVWSSPAVAYGMVFVGSAAGYYDSKFYALNASTGTLIWSHATGGRVFSSPAVADSMVFVGCYDDRAFYAFNAFTGALMWSYTTGGCVYSSPAVADGLLFIGSYDCRVYAFRRVHDVAVTDVTPLKIGVGQGYSVSVNVTVENQGDYTETFNLTAYYDDHVIEEQEITISSMSSTTVTFSWNTTGVLIGNYTISASVNPVPDEIDTDDNTYVDGLVTVMLPIHDVAVLDVTPSKTVVGQGYPVAINVTVENRGAFTETFNVTSYANTTEIQAKTVTNLNPLVSTVLTFKWDTAKIPIGNYTIRAIADFVPEEYNTTNNALVDGVVTIQSPVHDVAVNSVTPSDIYIGPGSSTKINVAVENQGNMKETFDVTVFANEVEIQTKTVTNMDSGTTEILEFTWDTTGFPLGNYTIAATASIVPGEIQTWDNTYVDGTVSIVEETLVYVSPHTTWIHPNQTFVIDVYIVNVVGLCAWQIKLHYNPIILSLIGVTGGMWDEGPDYVLIGDHGPPFTGSRKLCQITFKAETEGISYLDFSRPIPDDTFL